MHKLFTGQIILKLHFFHILPQAKYLFYFLRNVLYVYKFVSQTRLCVGVKETSDARLYIFMRKLMMLSH